MGSSSSALSRDDFQRVWASEVGEGVLSVDRHLSERLLDTFCKKCRISLSRSKKSGILDRAFKSSSSSSSISITAFKLALLRAAFPLTESLDAETRHEAFSSPIEVKHVAHVAGHAADFVLEEHFKMDVSVFNQFGLDVRKLGQSPPEEMKWIRAMFVEKPAHYVLAGTLNWFGFPRDLRIYIMSVMTVPSLIWLSCTCRKARLEAEYSWRQRCALAVPCSSPAPFQAWREMYLRCRAALPIDSEKLFHQLSVIPIQMDEGSNIRWDTPKAPTVPAKWSQYAIEEFRLNGERIVAVAVADMDHKTYKRDLVGASLYQLLANEGFPFFWPCDSTFLQAGQRFLLQLRDMDLKDKETSPWVALVDLLVPEDSTVSVLSLPLPPLKAVQCICAQIVQLLVLASSVGLDHGDLKSDNIMINRDTGQLCLVPCPWMTCFAFSFNNRDSVKGTPYWMAPEVIRSTGNHDCRALVWALGVVVHECLFREPPYMEFPPLRALFLITTKGICAEPDLAEKISHLTKEESLIALDFVRMCANSKQEERPLPFDLLGHPFVSGQAEEREALLEWLAQSRQKDSAEITRRNFMISYR